MKIGRSGTLAAGLLLCGGIVGFVLGHSAGRPTMAMADEPANSTQSGKSDAKPAAAASVRPPQRFGSMIGLRPEKKDEYIRLHANTWPEILALLKKCHIQHYSIYEGEVDGKMYLFSYFEYTGDDLAKEMAAMKADEKMRDWWKLTDPCQIRLPDTKEGDWWKRIPEVFHMD